MDRYLDAVQTIFDYQHKDTSSPEIPNIAKLIPVNFKIGLIVGPSGSGKTRLLNSLNQYHQLPAKWESELTVIEQIDPTPEIAIEKLLSAGFASVPQWFLPYSSLSEGQKFRCYIAITKLSLIILLPN